MKVKLDENLSGSMAAVFSEAGLDVHTVNQEGLGGSSDEKIFQACSIEKRVLVTLDLDFANPVRFSPLNTPGVMVLRPTRPTFAQIEATARVGLGFLKTDSPEGKLWIVELDRIRAFDPDVKE